jgi:hypothetical protein
MPGGLTFLAPLGLVALVALGVILLIHMRRRTPPAIRLPSLRFWEPVDAARSDRRRLQGPPLTLLLVLQLLAALAIGLALAKPAVDALPGLASQRTNPAHTIVILDGSTSMLAQAQEGDSRTRWDMARNEAVALLGDWQAGDVVTVLLAGARVESFSASTRPQADRLRSQLMSTEAPGGTAGIEEALTLASHLVLANRENRILLLTDGAVQVDPAIAASIEAPIDLKVVGTYDESLPNVAVTSIGARSVPGQDGTYRLSFSLTSFAQDPVRLPYRVQADGVDVAASELDLAGGETRPVEVTLPSGVSAAEVVVEVRDPFQADNSARILLDRSAGTGLNILLISDNPTTLERALGALPDAQVDTFSSTTPGIAGLAASYDLAVFHGTSPDPADIPAIPMLLVRPAPMVDLFQTSGVLSGPVVDRFDAGSTILDGVDLAGVTFGDTPIYTLAAGEQELVRGTANGASGPLIWTGDHDGKPYVVLGFDLETSNITKRVAFPVLIARSVAAITTPTTPGALALGDPLVYQPATSATDVQVTNPAGNATTHSVQVGEPIVFPATNRSGLYLISETSESGQEISTSQFVVNAGSLSESNLRSNADLAAALQGGATQSGSDGDSSSLSDLWPPLVIIAMIVIALEWLVSRLGSLRGLVPRRIPSLLAGKRG